MAKKNNSKLGVRLLAWILAALMVISMAYLTITFVSDSLRPDEQTEQA